MAERHTEIKRLTLALALAPGTQCKDSAESTELLKFNMIQTRNSWSQNSCLLDSQISVPFYISTALNTYMYLTTSWRARARTDILHPTIHQIH